MNKAMALLWGLGVGAGLMYFYDPDRGRRRRALLRDQAVRKLKEAGNTLETAARDTANRTRGLLAEATSVLSLDSVTDETLTARVRSRMGHLVSNPRAVHVTAQAGRVTLTGPILAREEERLLAGVAGVRGVVGVEDRLERHERPGDVPGLQGHRRRNPTQAAFDPANWTPTARLAASAAGGLLMAYGARRKGLLGIAAAPLGLGLLARTLQDEDVKRLFSLNHDPTA